MFAAPPRNMRQSGHSGGRIDLDDVVDPGAATLTAVDEAGKVIGASPPPASDATFIQATQTIAWTSSEIAVVWATSSRVQLARDFAGRRADRDQRRWQAPSRPRLRGPATGSALLWGEDRQIEVARPAPMVRSTTTPPSTRLIQTGP
jgi:hypothetical protein